MHMHRAANGSTGNLLVKGVKQQFKSVVHSKSFLSKKMHVLLVKCISVQ